ncbi:hypothetical protein LS482_11570 [Sinomicrobium kalidii]|uniref:hypothetical protein n=1 Tax=Sinomicrobium kalidii TaxID=2900738 RepID=UPI001E46272F|nr:hypothetical protein [Sinomicrobium kalidii]UGU14348.1 hypothetical protein LS482_11570 [Sinomicrobium kalidii]
MRRVILFSVFMCITLASGYAQGKVFAFFEYDIREGMKASFINGYAKDLEWQQSQGDDWCWAGWFVLNGDRRGRFIDATPDHTWKDFDNWKIDASENSRHNRIHWLPYVENPSGSYREVMERYSSYAKKWYRSKYLQVYYMRMHSGEVAGSNQFLSDLKPLLEDKLQGRPFVWMKTVSGGDPDTYLLFVGLNKLEDLQLCSELFREYSSGKENQGKRAVKEIISELWGYSDKLSLFPGRK